MPEVKIIIRAIDNYLLKTRKDRIGPVEANNMLAGIGVLNDSTDRRGKPLRGLLRKGLLPHAYQLGGKGTEWVIPLSTNVRTSDNIAKTPPQIAVRVKALPEANANNGSYISLMSKTGLKSAQVIDSLVPHCPGIYCIRVNNVASLPQPYSTLLTDRGHNILYIGIATKSLKVRFLEQELRAKGHGTLFRSIGAMLGYKPIKGSLKDKANKKNYLFPLEAKEAIVKWINANLAVNWVEFMGDLESVEKSLINEHLPLLNITHNPAALEILRNARADCIRIACE